MLTTVLPQMQEYLDTECEGFFRLPMPEVIYCYYDGKGEILKSFTFAWIWELELKLIVPNFFLYLGTHDVFVLGNLLADEYANFDEKKDFDDDHLKSLLECLAQLHGTGLAYKHKVGGSHHQLKEEFPGK